MPKKLQYNGTVSESGEIKFPNRLRKEVSEYFRGKRIRVTFERRAKTRSNAQNAYYWSVIVPHVLRGFIDVGNNDLHEGNKDDLDQVHVFLKRRFLVGREVHDKDGTLYQLDPSTRFNTTTEQEVYHENIRQFASEYLGIVIPMPNEQLEML